MMKIVEYRTASACDHNHTISGAVNKLIAEGFQPWGDPYLDINGYPLQAMVRYEDKKGNWRYVNKYATTATQQAFDGSKK